MTLNTPKRSLHHYPSYTGYRLTPFSKPRCRNRFKWTLVFLYALPLPFIIFFIFSWSTPTEVKNPENPETFSRTPRIEHLASKELEQATDKPYKTFSKPSDMEMKLSLNKILNEILPTETNALPPTRSAKSSIYDGQFNADQIESASITDEEKAVRFMQNLKSKTEADQNGDVVIFAPQRKSVNKTQNVSGDQRQKQEGRKLLETFFQQIIPEERFGALNVHMWEGICGNKVNQLRYSPFFPAFPSRTFFMTEFKSVFQDDNFGQRVFGFLHPIESGAYQFALISDDASELWLSSDEDPKFARLVTSVTARQVMKIAHSLRHNASPKYQAKVTRKIYLEKNKKYYIEALHKQETGLSYLEVLWKIPNTYSLETISGKYLSLYIVDGQIQDKEKSRSSFYYPKNVPIFERHKSFAEIDDFYYYNLSFVNWQTFSYLMPSCDYSPSYVTARGKQAGNSNRPPILTLTYRAELADGVSQTSNLKINDGSLADEDVVESVVNTFMNSLKKKFGR